MRWTHETVFYRQYRKMQTGTQTIQSRSKLQTSIAAFHPVRSFSLLSRYTVRVRISIAKLSSTLLLRAQSINHTKKDRKNSITWYLLLPHGSPDQQCDESHYGSRWNCLRQKHQWLCWNRCGMYYCAHKKVWAGQSHLKCIWKRYGKSLWIILSRIKDR